jgi:hypothetical protein
MRRRGRDKYITEMGIGSSVLKWISMLCTGEGHLCHSTSLTQQGAQIFIGQGGEARCISGPGPGILVSYNWSYRVRDRCQHVLSHGNTRYRMVQHTAGAHTVESWELSRSVCSVHSLLTFETISLVMKTTRSNHLCSKGFSWQCHEEGVIFPGMRCKLAIQLYSTGYLHAHGCDVLVWQFCCAVLQDRTESVFNRKTFHKFLQRLTDCALDELGCVRAVSSRLITNGTTYKPTYQAFTDLNSWSRCSWRNILRSLWIVHAHHSATDIS